MKRTLVFVGVLTLFYSQNIFANTPCGLVGSIEQRIKDCHFQKSIGSQGLADLVSRQEIPATGLGEFWQDQSEGGSRLIWAPLSPPTEIERVQKAEKIFLDSSQKIPNYFKAAKVFCEKRRDLNLKWTSPSLQQILSAFGNSSEDAAYRFEDGLELGVSAPISNLFFRDIFQDFKASFKNPKFIWTASSVPNTNDIRNKVWSFGGAIASDAYHSDPTSPGKYVICVSQGVQQNSDLKSKPALY